MKIWIIQTGERLPLEPGARMMRSGLLARELARRGHEVIWWASAFDHYRRDWVDQAWDRRELSPGLTLHLLRGTGYAANLSLRRFIDHAQVARRFGREASLATVPDVIVAAMPDYRIANRALCYARQRGVPFIVDLRDRWPWDFLAHLPRAARPFAKLALAADFAMAREVIAKAYSLVTMMQSWRPWIGREGARPWRALDRVFYLGAERQSQDPSRVRKLVRDAVARAQGRWPILFVGAFTNRSWPRQAIEAFRALSAQCAGPLRPILILAGDGDMRKEVDALAGDDPDIVRPGFVNDAEIAALLGIAKVGLVTLNGDYEAVPNKVFTYLSGGLPIVSSIGGELQAFLEHEQVGLTCRTPEALAEAVQGLMRDEPRRAAMSERSRAVFDERYEAARLYEAYADHVESVVASFPRSGQ